MSRHRKAIVTLCATLTTASAHAALQLTGVNLSGAEFNSVAKPGTYGTDYIYPNSTEINYYVKKGMNVFRLPFLWERLQPTLGSQLNTAELNRIKSFVNTATAAGAEVIIDPHNFGRYNGTTIGSGTVTDSQFANLWSQLATTFKTNNKVVFGLMNEPYGISSTNWVQSVNTAISSIRSSGAENMVLVPGVNYTGASSWTSTSYGTPNGVAMLNVNDPGNNYAFEVHQYLDSDSSGTHDSIVSTSVGVQRLQAFTSWCVANNKQAFLGEFGAPNDLIGNGATQIADEAIENMFDYMQVNSKIWLGWSWWGGGPWWNDNYFFKMDPTAIGTASQADRPSMNLVGPYLAGVPEPTAGLMLAGLVILGVTRRRQ